MRHIQVLAVLLTAAIFGTCLSFNPAAQAATFTWNVNANGAWNNSANWNPNTGFPNAIDDVANLTNDISAARTVSLTVPITIGTLNIGDSTTAFGGFTLQDGGGSLTFDVSSGQARLIKFPSGNVNAAADSITATITLNDDLKIINYDRWGNPHFLNISGNISGAGAGTKTIYLSGMGESTEDGRVNFTGSGVISDGGGGGNVALVANDYNNFRTGTPTTNIIQSSVVHTFTGGLGVNNQNGFFVLDYNNLATPTDLINSANTLTMGGGTLSLTQKLNTNTSQTFSGLTLANGGSRITLTQNGANTLTLNLGAITRSNTGTLNFNIPPSATLVATTSSGNDASGILGPWASTGTTTTLQYGTVSAGNIVAYTGATAAAANLADVTSSTTNYSTAAANTLAANQTGHTLRYTGAASATAIGANTLTLNGLMNAGTGAWTISSTGAGSLTAGTNNEIVVLGNAQNTAISATIKDGGGASGLTFNSNDGGLLTLSGTNTYTGPTSVNKGTVSISTLTNGGVAGNLGQSSSAASNLLLSGGTLTVTTGSSTDRLFTLGTPGGTILNSGAVTTNWTNAGSIVIAGAGDRRLDLNTNNASGVLNFAPIIGDPASGGSTFVYSSGAGRIILTGANTYTGRTFTSGNLRANDGTGLPTNSPLLLGAGGVLETSTNVVRSLGIPVEGTGTVSFNLGTGADVAGTGTSGFSAVGGPITVSLGGLATPTSIVWNSTANWLTTGALNLNNAAATHALTFKNPVNLNGATRTIQVDANTATMDNVISGSGTLSKTGAGRLNLTGTGATAMTMTAGLTFSNGMLVMSGSNTGTTGAISANNGTNNVNGWLEIVSGANYTATSLGVGNGNGSVMHMTGGQLTTTGGLGVGGLFGTTVRYYQSDGTLNVGGSANVGQDGASNDRAGIAVMSGGSFTVTGAMTLGPFRNGTGHLYLKDATTTVNGAGGITLGSTGQAGGGTGLIFLSDASTLQTRQVQRSTLNNPGFGESTMYFNGGTLVVLANNTNFLGPLLTPASGNAALGSVTENMVRVYALGATINTNGFDVTVNPALLAHTSTANNGIASATLANVGSGYSHPPNITFSGGGGSGATAVASLGANGAIDAIIITNPGAGYTTTPTINLAGGILIPGGVAANNTGATVSMVAASAGGLTKKGGGVLTLARGTSSYTGPTKVEAGTLSIDVLANGGSLSSIGGASNSADNIVLNGGTLRYTGTGHSTDRLFSVGTGNGTLQANGTGVVSFTNTGAMGFNSQSGARLLTLSGTNTGANTIAAVIGDNGGATSLTKIGNGQWVLSGNNTYTGNTDINQGTLALSNANNNNIAGSPLITVVGGAFLDTTGLGGAVDMILASGQTLTGTGTVTGNLTVGPGSTIAPGASPGTIVNAGDEMWDMAGNYAWEINDAGAAIPAPSGTAGNDPGWDLISITGSLTISATSGNPFVIELIGLTLGNAVGIVNDFDQTATYAWMIADSGSNVIGYAADKFTFDDSQFAPSNPYTGTFGVVLGSAVGGDDTQVWITYSAAVEAIPEPGTLGLAALGLIGLVLVGLRSRRRS